MLEGESSKIGKYRSNTQIVADMLKFLRDGPQNKSRVMGAVGISWPQLQAYGQRVLDAELVEVLKNGKWSITDKGHEFLTTTAHANDLLQVKA